MLGKPSQNTTGVTNCYSSSSFIVLCRSVYCVCVCVCVCVNMYCIVYVCKCVLYCVCV